MQSCISQYVAIVSSFAYLSYFWKKTGVFLGGGCFELTSLIINHQAIIKMVLSRTASLSTYSSYNCPFFQIYFYVLTFRKTLFFGGRRELFCLVGLKLLFQRRPCIPSAVSYQVGYSVAQLSSLLQVLSVGEEEAELCMCLCGGVKHIINLESLHCHKWSKPNPS